MSAPPSRPLLGVVNAGTAFAWAIELYDSYAWWFRLAGLAVLVALVWWSLRRRQACSIAGHSTWAPGAFAVVSPDVL
ncbi:hypothetical protein [Acrocarpospora sp. B8E8]|uniref:hypothetical protein n=1 Tax=Acrocarpospora sp. B8E8 TaxID=3153572 RepID=UPI00325EE9C3